MSKERTHEQHSEAFLFKPTGHDLPPRSSALFFEGSTPHPWLISSHTRSRTIIPGFFFAPIEFVSRLGLRAMLQRR
jgi:hypothetical protein